MAELEQLIAAGWGEVPQTYIPRNWRELPAGSGPLMFARYRGYMVGKVYGREKTQTTKARYVNSAWRLALRDTILRPLQRRRAA